MNVGVKIYSFPKEKRIFALCGCKNKPWFFCMWRFEFDYDYEFCLFLNCGYTVVSDTCEHDVIFLYKDLGTLNHVFEIWFKYETTCWKFLCLLAHLSSVWWFCVVWLLLLCFSMMILTWLAWSWCMAMKVGFLLSLKSWQFWMGFDIFNHTLLLVFIVVWKGCWNM